MRWSLSGHAGGAQRLARRWLPVALAVVAAVAMLALQQIYYGMRDAAEDGQSGAASILAVMELAGGHTPQAQSRLFTQAVKRFPQIDSATYCEQGRCLSSDDAAHAAACNGSWQWGAVCVAVASADQTRSVSVRYSMAETYRQALRDFACLVVILSIAAAIGSAASRSLRRRVDHAEQEAAFAISHDALTQLPNRAAFGAAADAMVHAGGASAKAPLLLYIDFDGFKDVNDNHGHDVGDLILRAAAARLQQRLEPGEVLGRLGGDEFGIVLQGAREPAVLEARVAALRAAFAEPVAVGGHSIAIGLSVGAVRLDHSVRSFQEALRRADVALYEAKRQGRGQLCHFTEALDTAARLRYRLQHELKAAIEHDQLFLEYQPQVDGRGDLNGVEALVRWRHPKRGLVRPDEFISVAEQSGLIYGLGLAVARIACTDLGTARRAGMHLPYVSINVSPKQLAEAAFVDDLLAVLETHRLGTRDLELEITESSLVPSRSGEEQAIRRLADLGFRIAIDDFGTGYSSLSRLRSMPVDKLKIDRSFVTPLPGQSSDRAIPDSILGLAQKLGLKTVAEGVETAEQAAWLHSAGCALMQGYYFARPMPLTGLLEWTMAREQAAIAPATRVWSDTRPFETVGHA